MDKKNFDFIDLTVTKTVEEWQYLINGIDYLLETGLYELLTEETNERKADRIVLLLQFKSSIVELTSEKKREYLEQDE
jgi:hypothetical protein